MIVLPGAENRTIVSSFIWTKHQDVTDRRIDGQTDRQICRGLSLDKASLLSTSLYTVHCTLKQKSTRQTYRRGEIRAKGIPTKSIDDARFAYARITDKHYLEDVFCVARRCRLQTSTANALRDTD